MDQRNQMTGPADDADLVVKMLNSGATGVMLDLEDSMANRWDNLMTGVRNIRSALYGEQADLEDAGLLSSPHTSAGRIPTAQGYRVFVDSLLQLRPLPEGELARLPQQPLEAVVRDRLDDRVGREPKRIGQVGRVDGGRCLT